MMRRAGARIERDGNRFRVEPGFDRPARSSSRPSTGRARSRCSPRPRFSAGRRSCPGSTLASPHPDAAFAAIAEDDRHRVCASATAESRPTGARGAAARSTSAGCPDLAPAPRRRSARSAPGGIVVENAPQLRVKESDRIEDLVAMLDRAGIRATARPDGFVVPGCWAESRPEAEVARPARPARRSPARDGGSADRARAAGRRAATPRSSRSRSRRSSTCSRPEAVGGTGRPRPARRG